MKYLLDANVLVALFDNKNANHRVVARWFSQQIVMAKHVWLSCAITQMACLRVLSLPSYPANYSFKDIQVIFDNAIASTNHVFLAKEINVVQANVIDWRHLQGHRQLTDAYLLALAVENQAVFVTLDNRINYRTVKNATPDNLLTLEL